MTAAENKQYIVVVQCDIVMERCSGYNCEKAFHERSGGFAIYPHQRLYRTLYVTCGGCCGRALHRKLCDLVRNLEKREGVTRDRIAVQLASCVTKDNFHGAPCPHLSYLRSLAAKLELDVFDDTSISEAAERRRREGRRRSDGA